MMKESFYSILKFIPNKATNDSIALGIILFKNNKFYSYFSAERIKLSNRLIGEISVKKIVSQFQNKIEKLNSEYEIDNKSLLPQEQNIFAYFNYLNAYSNGLISFEEPKLISEKFQLDDFTKMCHYFFPNDSFEQNKLIVPVENSANDFNRKIQKNLIRKVSDIVNTDYKFTPKNLPSIYFDYELDCIGKNGSLIGAKSLLFDQSESTIDKKISHYFQLISSLISTYHTNFQDNSFYLITEEPKDISSKNHKIWESVKINQVIKVIEPEEAEKVVDEINERNAKAFLTN